MQDPALILAMNCSQLLGISFFFFFSYIIDFTYIFPQCRRCSHCNDETRYLGIKLALI